MSSSDSDSVAIISIYEPEASCSDTRITRSRRLKNSRKKNDKIQENITVIDLTEPDIKPKKKRIKFEEDGIEFSMDEDSDYELEEDFRIIWTPTVSEKRYSLKPSEILLPVYEDLSKIHKIPIDQIHLRLNDRVLSKYDTLLSIKMKVTEVIKAYPVNKKTENCMEYNINKVEVKCLFNNLKKPLVFYLYPLQNINDLLDLCAKKVNSSVDMLEFRFDGEKVRAEDTPCSLEFEGGECLEVHVK